MTNRRTDGHTTTAYTALAVRRAVKSQLNAAVADNICRKLPSVIYIFKVDFKSPVGHIFLLKSYTLVFINYSFGAVFFSLRGAHPDRTGVTKLTSGRLNGIFVIH